MIIKSLMLGGCLTTAYAAWATLPEKRFKRVLHRVIRANNIYDEERRPDGKRFRQYPRVTYCYEEWYGYTATVTLPVNIAPSEFQRYKEIFETVTNSEIDMEFEGRACHMRCYQMPLYKVMNFNEQLIREMQKRELSVVVGFSRRGLEVLKFGDEAGAHVLIAGGTGMGKSILLRVIVTSLLHRYGHSIHMTLINNKITDNYPFMGIPNVTIEQSVEGAVLSLEEAVQVIDKRKKQLYSKGYIDAKEWNDNEVEKMTPYFIVVDEAARFAGNKDFEKLVIEIAETGRFVEMHLVIATQRPDGRDVLSPRIKDNCLTKIAFRTGTKGGSELILGDDTAYNLPHIPGRAVLYVNQFRTMQVPYMSKNQCLELVKHLKIGRNGHVPDSAGQRYIGKFVPIRNHES